MQLIEIAKKMNKQSIIRREKFYAERITRFGCLLSEKEKERDGDNGRREGGLDAGGQAIISNSVRSNGSYVRLSIIESGKRGCLIEVSRALFGLGC